MTAYATGCGVDPLQTSDASDYVGSVTPSDGAKGTAMPKSLGRYEVRAKIGEGGMATVYVGREHLRGGQTRVVALKVIKDEFSQSRDFVNMFIDEAGLVKRLSHPNVVKLHELANDNGRLFIAMELLFGQSLWETWDACRARKIRLRYDLV